MFKWVKQTFFPADISSVTQPDTQQQQQQQQQCLSRIWRVSLSPCVNTRPSSCFVCSGFFEKVETLRYFQTPCLSGLFLKGDTLWQFKSCLPSIHVASRFGRTQLKVDPALSAAAGPFCYCTLFKDPQCLSVMKSSSKGWTDVYCLQMELRSEFNLACAKFSIAFNHRGNQLYWGGGKKDKNNNCTKDRALLRMIIITRMMMMIIFFVCHW